MQNIKRRLVFTIFLLIGFLQNNSYCQLYLDSNPITIGNLEKGFAAPPLFAKPRVFWWWLNSKATKESITRDLEELKAKGFGGALIFDAGSSNYEVARKTEAGPVYGSPGWLDLFVFALSEAERLGLEMSLNIVSGWNPGGPTVTAKDALKKIVWNEKIVHGPLLFSEILDTPKGEYFKDVALQAYKINEGKEKAHLQNWELKTLNQRFKGFDEYPLYKMRQEFDSLISGYDVKKDSIIELTDKIDANGKLTWSVPEGTWKIIRIGSALTGVRVSTASDGYDGFSFDHLNSEAFNNFFNQAVEPILNKAEKYIGKSLKYLMTDSWEMGIANWTEDFCDEFKKRRGYEPEKYLSVITGQIVENREISNRFLYDFRKTVGDCIADETYSQFAEAAHKRGLFLHPESGGPHAAPIDGLKCLGRNDFTMGEFWARSNTHRITEDHRLFLKQSSSAAHIYGKRFVAGEGPTSIGPHWERSPKDLKSVFDRNLCEGINRFYWHCFTSSPKEFGLPGNEYFAGTHLNPNTTWWNNSKAFIDYLARSSYLLSQGIFRADVLFYYGDDVPVFGKRKKVIPELGFGFDYDECNAEIILTRLSVNDGKLVLPDGMSYHLLRLPDQDAITLEVLQKIEKLVLAGATVVGQKPLKATGLTGYPDSDLEVINIADRLWGKCDGKTIFENSYGKGKILWGKPLREILHAKNVLPDFEYSTGRDSSQIDYIHRKTDYADIYFVVNRLARNGIYDTKYRYITNLPDRFEWVDCKFNVSGMIPEIWNPMTGVIEDVVVYKDENGFTIVPLQLEPEGSRFVIFRKPGNLKNIVSLTQNGKSIFPVSNTIPEPFPPVNIKYFNKKLIAEVFETGLYECKYSDDRKINFSVDAFESRINIDGLWNVKFADCWGKFADTVFEKLSSWTESGEEFIKYFSGTAEYKNTFVLTSIQIKNKKLYLDLGNVQELAEVILNGKNIGVSWMPPFIVDITDMVKTGNNELCVRVTNLWPNRLIGDQNLPEDKRKTKTNIQKFKKDDPLRVSGLLGPVKIVISKIIGL